jgi:hypothetical protein
MKRQGRWDVEALGWGVENALFAVRASKGSDDSFRP